MSRMFEVTIGDGATLRPVEPWQAKEFLEHVDRVREHINPWVPVGHRVVDLDTARALLQQHADRQARDTGRLVGIYLADALVGGVVFPRFNVVTGQCEVGIWLDPAAQGSGLATSAARHMIDWAVTVRGIQRVEWQVNPVNGRSKAVAMRLGMTYEGTLRAAYALAGDRQDTEVWSVLAAEWRSPW